LALIIVLLNAFNLAFMRRLREMQIGQLFFREDLKEKRAFPLGGRG